MTANRTDAHRPAEARFEDYTYIGSFDRNMPYGWLPLAVAKGLATERDLALLEELRAFQAMIQTSTHRGNYATKGTCDHCGVHFRYAVAFRHNPSGDVIVTGEQCATERFDWTRDEWEAKQLREQARVADVLTAFAEAHPDLDVMLSPAAAGKTHSILGDMATKLRRYGSLSDKQIAFARRLVAEATGAPIPAVGGVPPTDKQLAFFRSLCEERGLDADALAEGLDRRALSAKIDEVKATPRPGREKQDAARVELARFDIPAGRYAIDRDGHWDFFQVDRPTEGKWAGYVFLSQLFGAPGDWNRQPIKDLARKAEVFAAVDRDVMAAAVAFGRESGECSQCGSPLSNEGSIAAGIGPVCAKNLGVKQRELAAQYAADKPATSTTAPTHDEYGDPLPF